jgi:PadR family transcriptional regulator PadR
MARSRPDLVKGTLDMLILKTLALEPMHGWGITHRIQQMSQEVLQVNQGSLYPALHRMMKRGWIRSEWRTTGNNRRARYYLLTRSGEQQLRDEVAHWLTLSAAVTGIVSTTGTD